MTANKRSKSSFLIFLGFVSGFGPVEGSCRWVFPQTPPHQEQPCASPSEFWRLAILWGTPSFAFRNQNGRFGKVWPIRPKDIFPKQPLWNQNPSSFSCCAQTMRARHWTETGKRLGASCLEMGAGSCPHWRGYGIFSVWGYHKRCVLMSYLLTLAAVEISSLVLVWRLLSTLLAAKLLQQGFSLLCQGGSSGSCRQ